MSVQNVPTKSAPVVSSWEAVSKARGISGVALFEEDMVARSSRKDRRYCAFDPQRCYSSLSEGSSGLAVVAHATTNDEQCMLFRVQLNEGRAIQDGTVSCGREVRCKYNMIDFGRAGGVLAW